MQINEFTPDLGRLRLLVRANVDRINVLMKDAGIGALFVITNDNWRYLTGLPIHHSAAYSTVNAAILVQDSDLPVLLPLDFFASRIHVVAPWYRIVRELPFNGTPEAMQPTGAKAWPRIVVEAFRELGLSSSTIALDAGTPYVLQQEIKALLTTARFVDASALLRAARIVKNPFELESIAKACRIADQAIESALDSATEHATETEVAGVVEAIFREKGAEYATMMPCVFSGDHPLLGYVCSTDKILSVGELVRLDIACSVDGYCCCIARTGFLGTPDRDLIKAYGVLKNALMAGVTAISPGVANTQVHETMHRVLQEQSGSTLGLDWYGGHGIGLGLHEQPMIGRAGFVDDIALQPGMTFALEPSILIPGKGWLGLEDNVLVTQTGAEVLSHARFGLTSTDKTAPTDSSNCSRVAR